MQWRAGAVAIRDLTVTLDHTGALSSRSLEYAVEPIRPALVRDRAVLRCRGFICRDINARTSPRLPTGPRKYGTAPYVHLDDVAKIGDHRRYGLGGGMAYLHDVLEDTSVTAEAIRGTFRTFVRRCVEIVTDPPGATRKERKALLHERLKAVPESHHLALIVKAADRWANVRSSARTIRACSRCIERNTPPSRTPPSTRGLCDELWAEMEQLLR